MTKKGLFLKIGLALAKAVVPGVAQVQEVLEDNVLKHRTVEGLAVAALEVGDLLTSDGSLLSDPDFKEGVRLQITGARLIQKAVERHHTAS